MACSEGHGRAVPPRAQTRGPLAPERSTRTTPTRKHQSHTIISKTYPADNCRIWDKGQIGTGTRTADSVRWRLQTHVQQWFKSATKASRFGYSAPCLRFSADPTPIRMTSWFELRTNSPATTRSGAGLRKFHGAQLKSHQERNHFPLFIRALSPKITVIFGVSWPAAAKFRNRAK